MKRIGAFVIMLMLVVGLVGLAACGETPEEPSGKAATEPAGKPSESAGTQTAAPSDPSSGSSLRVSCIDVGKGDCILVQAGDTAILIDTGYEKTADDVLAHLQEAQVTHLKAVVITHYDRDHVEGLHDIGQAVPIDTIYLPGYEGSDDNYDLCLAAVDMLGVPSQRVTSELALDVGSARLTIFPSTVAYEPASILRSEGNDNDVSLVATLVNGSDSYLFAGDLEEEGVDAYLTAKHGTFDVVKMPHHGRKSSNTEDFLDDVRPQIALITDSKKDEADKKVLKLLKSSEVETYRTSKDGTIVVESNGSGTYQVDRW